MTSFIFQKSTNKQSIIASFPYLLSLQYGTELTQLEVIDLFNDGSGLGFGIIGVKKAGVVVKTILPEGVSYKVCGL